MVLIEEGAVLLCFYFLNERQKERCKMYSVKGTITAVPSQISESWLYSPDYLTTMHILESALHVMRDIESRFRIREHRAIFAKKPGSRMKQAVTRSILVNCLKVTAQLSD